MKKIIQKLKYTLMISLLVVGIVLTGCKESWLSPEPLSFYDPDKTFNEVGGLQSAIIACEKNLRQEWYGDAAPRNDG